MFITVEGLAFFLIFCSIILVTIFLVIVLVNLNSLIKSVNSVLKKNNENIDKTMATLPEAVQNVNDIAVNVKGNLEKAGSVIGSINGAIADTAMTVSESTDRLIAFVTAASSIIKVVKNMFSPDKKD